MHLFRPLLHRPALWRGRGLLLLLGCLCLPAVRAAAASEEAVTERTMLTSVAEMFALPEQRRNELFRMRCELMVTYYDPFWRLLWARDGAEDVYLPLASVSPRVKSGQRILVEGTIVPAKGLDLAEANITVLAEHHGLAPLPTQGDLGNTGRFNPRLVVMEGLVEHLAEVDPTHFLMELVAEGRRVTARVLIEPNAPIPQVEGALVRISGVYVASVEPPETTPAIVLWATGENAVEITGWLDRDPRFGRPETPIEQVPNLPENTLVRLVGTVRAHKPGSELVLRDDTGQVRLRTAMTRPVQVGERIEAIGWSRREGAEIVLAEALYRRGPSTASADDAPVRGTSLLRLVEQVRELTPDEADRGCAVRLRGMVMWSSPQARFLFLADGTGGIRVDFPAELADPPPPGRRVRLNGVTAGGAFAPLVRTQEFKHYEQLPLPEARPVTLQHAMTGAEEGQRVSISAYVRAVVDDGFWTRLELSTAAGEFAALLPRTERLAALAGCVVRLRGVCTALADEQRQLTSIRLWVTGEEEIEVEEPRPLDPFAVPLRSVTSLRQFNTMDAFNRRVRIAGVVLNHAAGSHINLQQGAQGLLVLSRDTTPLSPGDQIEAVGFPGRQNGRVVLREATYRRTGPGTEPAPLLIGEVSRVDPELDGRLVRIEAVLLDAGAQRSGIRLICQSGSAIVEALLDSGSTAPRHRWNAGTKLELTGVYQTELDEYGAARSMHLRLRRAADVRIVQRAPWWTAERGLLAVEVLAVAILASAAWVTALRRRVNRQTAEIRTQLEKSSRLEAELIRSSKLESLGVLAGGIAHDFNNLLTVVMGNLSLVLGDERLDGEAQRFLRESEKAALRARDLTQQLLTFAKGGAPVRAAVLLPDIVREAAGFALHGAKVRCDFDFAAGLWAADVDRGQIAQVVHNIVINAMQAMPAGGVVRIELRNARLETGDLPGLARGRYVQLTIVDTGAGIPVEHLARIFDPYFTTKQQGSGLGLATVYSIVKKHHGYVQVNSELGRGTSFKIWLPAAEDAPVKAAAKVATPRAHTGRVLFMDDEAPIRDFARALLERSGFEVEVAPDGEDSVRRFVAAREQGRPFALVILDLTVPGGMGGSEALVQLRTIDPEVKAIVSSGYSSDPVLANYRAHGLCGIVPKPYKAGDLLDVVTAALERNGVAPGEPAAGGNGAG